MDIDRPKSPTVLGDRGQELWARLNEDFEFDTHELSILNELCRCIDHSDALIAAVDRDGVTVAGSRGQTVVHPALQEYRQLAGTIATLIKRLNLDSAAVQSARAQGARVQHAEDMQLWRARKSTSGRG